MAAMSRPSSRRGRQDAEQLLEPFLDALAGPQLNSIPQDTVLGAITHFMSTLSIADLPHLVDSVLTSNALWSGDYLKDGQLRHAMSLSVQAKVGSIQKKHERSWLASRRISRESRGWLHAVRTAIGNHGEEKVTNIEAERRTLELRAGLIAGVRASDRVDWPDELVTLEEEIILALADLDLKTIDKACLSLLCEVINHIDSVRIAVLDLQTLLPTLQAKLLESLDQRSEHQDRPSSLASALARAYCVRATEARDSGDLLESMGGFITSMRRLAESHETQLGRKGPSKLSDQEWNRHKTSLFAFLTPASAIIDIMIEREQTNASDDRSGHASLAIGIVETLAAFSYITEQTEGGLEGHDRVLLGSLDILEATSGASGVSRLFQSLVTVDPSPHRAAFVLRAAEQLVGTIDGQTLSRRLLPLCEQYLHRAEDSRAFEAAHAVMLALIVQAGKSDERPLPQNPFLMEIIPFYTQLLLKQFAQSKISADQLRSSYPTVTEIASKTDDQLAQQCINQLDMAVGKEPDERQTLLLLRISLAPYIPIRGLRGYLNLLAVDIIETPPGEGRLELAAKAFGMVVNDLGDDRKQMGREWWLKWKRDIESSDKPKTIKAKL